MTDLFALEYLKLRFKEMGLEDHYTVRYRSLQIDPLGKRLVEAKNSHFFLIDEPFNVTIKSQFGYYDLSDGALTEQLYEHRGAIEITNSSSNRLQIKFIQAIPKTLTKDVDTPRKVQS